MRPQQGLGNPVVTMPWSVPVLVLVALSAALSGPAWAGPPFITDDPEPVAYKHWEINTGFSKTWRNGSSSAAIPGIDINYGASPDLQLHAQPRYSDERDDTGHHVGVDDTEIGVKYRFLHLQSGGTEFMAGIYPMYQVPTGAARLGPNRGKGQVFLPTWIQASNERWTLYGGAGYRINQGAGNRNSVFVGMTALYKVTQTLQLGGELFHESPDAVGASGAAGFNIGGSVNLATDVNLLFSVGKGLTSVAETNQKSAYVALQTLY
jgi:hypothetical protein